MSINKAAIVHVEYIDDRIDQPVWLATSEDIDGLVAEADTLDELFQLLSYLVPEMIAENHQNQKFKVLYEINSKINSK